MSTKGSLYTMRNPEYTKGLLDLINTIKKYRNTKEMTMIEIGSYAGESTVLFAKEFKKVISIDPFINDYDVNDVTCSYMELDNVYNVFKNNTENYENITHIRKTSDDAVLDLNNIKVDFVYIDGMHTYDQVNKDIKNYLPLVMDDGFIGGHDYHPVWQGVMDAIIESLGVPNETFCDTSWLLKKNENFINIITPCSRPENLHAIAKSINIPSNNYRWVVVFDMDTLPDKSLIPDNCEVHLFRDRNSKAGHAQRNYAISVIDNGYVYSNDDDTLLHPDLWEEIKYLNNDFISFSQINKDGSLRLVGDTIEVNHIDSHNFIVSKDIIKDTKYIINDYAADGHFAKECNLKSKNKIFINKVLSTYNQLR
jgi:hypothetical protein